MPNKEVSLSDLANGTAQPTAAPVGMPATLDPKKVSEVNKSDVAMPGPSSDPVAAYTTGIPMLDDAMRGLDGTVERIKKDSTALVEQGREERLEKALEAEDYDDDAVIGENTSNTIHVQSFDEEPVQQITTPTVQTEVAEYKPVTVKMTIEDRVEEPSEVVTVDTAGPVTGTVKKEIKIVKDTDDDDVFVASGIDDDDLQFLDDEEDAKADEIDDDDNGKTEEIKETIRAQMKENFKPFSKIDLNSFKISKKPIAAVKVISEIKGKPIECADAVLYDIGRPIRMSAWGPMEIQSINPEQVRSGSVNYNAFMEKKLRLVYDHLIDANKPKSFEAWAMATPNTTMDDYMFAAYKATYGQANIVTFNCPDDDCVNVFMENVPVNQMIKFKDEETKKKYYDILHSGTTDTVSNEYEVTLHQISDNFVLGLKKPSLYNTYIEPTLLDAAFSAKYQDLLLLMTYIDCAYMIDKSTNELILIDTKPIANDRAKTYKRRIKTFDTILKSLTSDQLQALNVETDKYDAGKLDDNGNLIKDITYVFPERRCPKCGKKIDEVEVAPDNMLFTRHQLGLMNKI